jgi:S1 RNA binding domain protein
MSIEVGAILSGRVTGITHFGAFVDLGDGKTGLVHISEVADTYVKDIKDYVKENDVVKVKVITIKDGKIGLSMRQAVTKRNAYSQQEFENRLANFLKDSDEKLQDLKKSIESKRGGRGARYTRNFGV